MFSGPGPIGTKRLPGWGSAMTPTEKWMLGLVAVYSIPSFLFGVGMTLLFIRRRAFFTFPLPSKNKPERHDRMAGGFAPADGGATPTPAR